MKSLTTTSFFIVLLLAACIKKPAKPAEQPEELVNVPLTQGLPENVLSINGYLYYSQGGFSNSRAFACFSDPRKNLISSFNHINNFESRQLGNLSVGRVICSGTMLQEFDDGQNSFSYSGFPNNTPQSIISWSTDGNGPFKGFSLTLPRGTPYIDQNLLPALMYRSKDLVINLGSVVQKYDSVVVLFSTNANPLRKSIAYPENQIIVTSAEITAAFPFQTFCQLNFHAFNYAHSTINSKNYVFECGSSVNRSMQIVD